MRLLRRCQVLITHLLGQMIASQNYFEEPSRKGVRCKERPCVVCHLLRNG